MGYAILGQTPAETKKFSVLRNVQTGYAQFLPVSYPGVKVPERDVYRSTPNSTKVNNEQRHISAPLIWQHGVESHNFALVNRILKNYSFEANVCPTCSDILILCFRAS